MYYLQFLTFYFFHAVITVFQLHVI